MSDKPTVVSTGGADRVGHEDEHKGAVGPIKENGQHSEYWVLSEDERAKGFIRPVREVYVHDKCGAETRMNRAISETYARDPKFYGSTFCCHCGDHSPVAEFKWKGSDEVVGS